MSKKFPALVFLLLCSCALALLVSLPPSGAAHDGDKHIGEGGNGQPDGQPMKAMGLTPCVNGKAGTFPCHNVDLASFLPLAEIGGGTGNDVWGWTDPETNKEYALMGRSNGTAFVDISDAEHPVYLGNLPTQPVPSAPRVDGIHHASSLDVQPTAAVPRAPVVRMWPACSQCP